MTVGAVSGMYQYSNSYQYLFFGTTITAESLNMLMRQYNIIQTGDEYTDMLALYEAMYSQASTKLDSTKSSQQQSAAQSAASNAPWGVVMQEVGLTVTGDLQTDYAAFNAQIKAMEQALTSDKDKQELQAFVAAAQTYFTEGAGSSTTGTVSSAEIVASVNKAFAGL